jgi:NADH-quinone oxidoreductase subunit M
VVYIGLVALVQSDMKAHRLLVDLAWAVTLGIFIFTADGMLAQSCRWSPRLRHGGAILCVAFLRPRTGPRFPRGVVTPCRFSRRSSCLRDGQLRVARHSGFVGEFSILGAMKSASFLPPGRDDAQSSARPTLWMIKRVVYGAVASPRRALGT